MRPLINRFFSTNSINYLMVFVTLCLQGCIAASTQISEDVLASEAGEIAALGTSGPILATVDIETLLAQVTKAPALLSLPTLTIIPSVTPMPTATLPAPTATMADPTPEETEEESQANMPLITVPERTPTAIFEGIAVNIEPTPTSPLPDLPSILPTPVLTQTVRVPILMYHYVSTPPEDADRYRVNLSVEPEAFDAQMQVLQENDIEVIDLYTITDHLVRSKRPPENSVVLTFDDGYVDNYEVAFPILEKYGFKGTFFIVTEFVDNENPNYMSWEMIEEMAAAGHRFESHTKSHPDLSSLRYNDLVWQILGSQETLAAHIGYKPQYLSYPSGRYNEETVEMVEELSLWGAVTTQTGVWRNYYDRFEWQRSRISYSTTIRDFERIVIPN